MNIVIASDLRRNGDSRYNYICKMLSQQKLTRYEKDGKLAFDMDEYNNYRANARKGRPLKGTTIKII